MNICQVPSQYFGTRIDSFDFFVQVLESHNLTAIRLGAKEGLAMINGTQLIASISAEAVERAGIIARQADVVAALTLEVLKGTTSAFDSGKFLLLLLRC